jgi:hypothetical protein
MLEFGIPFWVSDKTFGVDKSAQIGDVYDGAKAGWIREPQCGHAGRDGNKVSEFRATVTDIREESRAGGKQRWQMALDRTEFSAGAVGELHAVARSGVRLVVPVLGTVVDAAGEVWHLVEKPLAAGTTVTGRVRSE